MTADRQPVLRVVRGEPTDAELAALTCVVTARLAAAASRSGARPVPSRWAAPRPRPALRAGPGAWVGSGLTR